MENSVYAIIKKGKVVNLCVGTYASCNESAKAIFGDNAFAQEVWSMYYPPTIQLDVQIGDVFSSDGHFYHNGELVMPRRTIENDLKMQSDIIDELIIAITPTSEG